MSAQEPQIESWMMAEAEQRLLDFVGSLIVELARSNSRVNEFQVALWLARIAKGVNR